MGEVIHGDYSRWANPEMLHSVTNYELHKGLWSGHNDHNYFEIAHTMRRLQGLCHDTRLYLFSDNHDVERLPNKLRNREHIRHIAILVYSLWGIPSIYYGSEFGIEGKKEWGSDWPLRPCLELSDYADAERTNPVTSVYKALGKCKAELPEMTYGEVKELQLTTQCYAFARVLDGKAVVAVLKQRRYPRTAGVPAAGGNRQGHRPAGGHRGRTGGAGLHRVEPHEGAAALQLRHPAAGRIKQRLRRDRRKSLYPLEIGFPLPGEAFVQKAEIGITLHILPRFATIRREKSFYGKEA